MGWFKEAAAGDATLENGWIFTTKTGLYGTNYLQRALITAIGLGANRPQDAVYPTSEADADGKPYSGANKYVLHFEKGELPPVDGFWSLTMYDARVLLRGQPAEPLHAEPAQQAQAQRRTARSTSTSSTSRRARTRSRTGSRRRRSEFILMMRLYWPKEKPPSILDGTWKIPAVKPAS